MDFLEECTGELFGLRSFRELSALQSQKLQQHSTHNYYCDVIPELAPQSYVASSSRRVSFSSKTSLCPHTKHNALSILLSWTVTGKLALKSAFHGFLHNARSVEEDDD